MSEVNILKDSNQLFNDEGSSFALSKDELYSILDDNTNSTVLVVGMGASDVLKLKGDLGSRYFVKNVSYYATVPISNGVVIEISQDDLVYTEAPLSVDPDTFTIIATISDYIRYVKLSHTSPSIYFADFVPRTLSVSSTTTDTYGSKHVNTSPVNDVFSYDSSTLTWSSPSTKSWFIEPPLVNVRGRRRDFPPHTLIVCTSNSVDILDLDKFELWMRFNTGASTMLGTGTPYRCFALNGCIYISMQDSSIILLDFYNDTSIKFTTSGRYTGNKTIANRNTATTYTISTNTVYPCSILSNSVNEIRGATTDFGDIVAVATISGCSILMSKSAVLNSTDGTLPTISVAASKRGSVYWASKLEVDNVLNGEVSYVSDFTDVVGSGAGVSNYLFNRNGYYNQDLYPYLINNDITSISVI